MNRVVPTVLLVSALASAFGGCEPRPGKEPIKPSVDLSAAHRAPHGRYHGYHAHHPYHAQRVHRVHRAASDT